LRTELVSLGRPVIELPTLPGGVTRKGLGQLSGLLSGALRPDL
jgi:hypothetical protein